MRRAGPLSNHRCAGGQYTLGGMEWYWWVAAGIVALAIVTVLGLRLFRATRRGRRFLGLSLRGKLRFGRLLLEDREVPLPAKVLLAVLVGYLALPLDLIPDFIPVLGQLDDAFVVLLAIGLLLMAVPRERFDAALDGAEADDRAREAAGARRVDPDAPFADTDRSTGRRLPGSNPRHGGPE